MTWVWVIGTLPTLLTCKVYNKLPPATVVPLEGYWRLLASNWPLTNMTDCMAAVMPTVMVAPDDLDAHRVSVLLPLAFKS